ncbi:prenyltransferase/squalene oxidase repeat-containing protein [Nonomuraea sp. NPDC050451]|uniref:prenyltransferase/squalene oxidase repeat-containing protein n=1 Tax=Nonomuraea sp. NPDC050451 TaxID=3364364 RepID=UPI003795ED19
MAGSARQDQPDVKGALRRAEEWLRACYKSAPTGSGWGHHVDEDPTEWGGTLDGIRGMMAVKAEPNCEMLVGAAGWLRGRQNPDGGFPSREMKYSPAEATAWVVIALRDMGWHRGNDPHVERAVEYLRACVDDQGAAATTSRDIGSPRTLPTALTLWALSLQEGLDDIRGLITTRLRLMQEPESKGWGIKVGATPNAATTAQVLHAVRLAGVPEEVDWVRDGVTYLLGRQKADGSWENSYDEWFTAELEGTPSRCVHYGTGWALLALTDFPSDPRCQEAAERAVRYLLGRQRTSGAWLFEEYDPTEFVWCTTQIMVALAKWQEIRPTQPIGTLESDLTRVLGRAASWARESFLYLAFGALLVAQTWEFIRPVLAAALAGLKIDIPGIWTNLISSLIWLLLTLALAWAGKRIGKAQKNRP